MILVLELKWIVGHPADIGELLAGVEIHYSTHPHLGLLMNLLVVNIISPLIKVSF